MSQQHKLMPPPVIVFTRLEQKVENKRYLEFFNPEKLRRRLASAVEAENYEAAVLYRNELKRRNLL